MLLLNAMENAGFTNYGTEFWHFSAEPETQERDHRP
ncbi:MULTISPECIES: M15 family metallopeptidase [unclassified Streptomyces]|nr:M15 family metallopeptidase [Streptomyces sp. NRRL F-5122]